MSWFQQDGKILRHEPLGPGLYQLTLHASDIAGSASPGQFVNLRVSERVVPLLRRPFSLAEFDPDRGTVTIIYQVVGEGTALLAECRPGQVLSLLGPLGRGFPTGGTAPLILLGGGVGTAPLIGVAQAARRAGRSVSALIGARTVDLLIGEEAMIKAGVMVQVCTDDGTRGVKGFPTDLLEDEIRSRTAGTTYGRPEVFACGPVPMLKVVQDIARRTGTPAYVSLETIMACGVGACLGCSCRLKSGCREIFGKVCTDGPVFDVREVAL